MLVAFIGGNPVLTMLIVDDEYLVRKGVSETIEWKDYGIQIAGDACDGGQGLELAISLKPDIILTDVHMPFMDGLEFMSKLRENGLDSRIIVLSGYEDFNYVRTALQHGAIDYLLKPIDNRQLVETVQKVAARIKEERSTSMYFNRLKSELSTIKKQFLRDIILGNTRDRDEILEKIGFLELPVELSCNHIISIRINEYNLVLQQLNREELSTFRELIVQSVAQLLLLNSRFMGILIEKDEEEWVIVLHMLNPEDNIVEIMKERCLELTGRIKNSFSQTLSIGISDICDDIEKLHLAYKDAYSASFFRLLPGCSSVGYIRERDAAGYRREIREALNYIKANYSRDISIEMAAKELFISPSYLMHLFRDEVGRTFNECLTDYRIQIAKEMLRNPKYKIYEVCGSVGYGDVKYFSQVFKKVTGMSPSDYIRNET